MTHDQDRLAELETKVAALEAYIVQLTAERDEVIGDLRAEVAQLEADFEEHLEACPGKSRVNQRRAKRKSEAGPPPGRAEGA